MAWPTSLSMALKEWAVVCQSLENGRQIMLLRKGGIYESAGEFEVEHREFLLFPTYLHQNADMLKPPERKGVATEEPRQITISSACVVSDIVQIHSRSQIDALDDEHVWAKPLIDMRFAYRPENPLYLLLVRAYRLAQPIVLENTPEYAGCKSWVPLAPELATGDSLAVLDDVKYEFRSESILRRLRT